MNTLVKAATFVAPLLTETTSSVPHNKNGTSAVLEIIAILISVISFFVSLYANTIANKTRKEAKHIGLADRRFSAMIEFSQQGTTNVDALLVLFDKQIVQAYEDYCASVAEKDEVAHDLNVYADMLSMQDGEGDYSSPIAHLMHFEQQLEQFGNPIEQMIEFRDLCERYEITYNESGEPCDSKLYNYEQLSRKLGSATKKATDAKTAVIELMQEYIQKTLSPNEK